MQTNGVMPTHSQSDIRAAIFNVLYAAEGHEYNVSLESIIDNLSRGFELDIFKNPHVLFVASGIVKEKEQLDSSYTPFLANWKIERIGLCTKLILRLAIWELNNTKTPAAVIINEAVELAKCFAERDSYKFINGILDQYAKSLQSGVSIESTDIDTKID